MVVIQISGDELGRVASEKYLDAHEASGVETLALCVGAADILVRVQYKFSACLLNEERRRKL